MSNKARKASRAKHKNTQLKKLAVFFWLIPILCFLFFMPLFGWAIENDKADGSEWRGFVVSSVFLIMAGISMCFVNDKYKALWRHINDNQTVQTSREWQDFIKRYEAKHGTLAEETKNLSLRIGVLYWSDGFDFVLPFEQAERLLDAHQKQSARIEQLDEKIERNELLIYELNENLRELWALGETNRLGESSLKELTQNNTGLLSLREEIAASTRKLEDMVSLVEREWKRRSLHDETNILAQKAQKATSEHSAQRMLPDMPLDFEHQITHEIETYLQLERETQQRLGS